MRNWKPLKKHPNIYEYESRYGKRYGIRRTFQNVDNKRTEFTKSGFKTWKDANAVLIDFENKLNTNQLSPLSHRNLTVQECFELLIKYKLTRKVWKKSTHENYLNYYNNYLKSTFGKMKLESVTRIKFETFINTLVEKGLANTTIKTICSILQAIFNFAEMNDFIQKNKLRGVSVIGGTPPKEQKLERKDFEKWILTGRNILSKYLYGVLSLSAFGERRSELLGLRFKDVKFISSNECEISWKVGRTPYQLEGGSLKNESSVRKNYISGEVVKEIKFLIDYSKNIYTNCGLKVSKDDFILVNESTAKPFHPTYINRIFKKVNKASGITVNPHLLRHYFATQALNNPNVSDLQVMHWLGHSSLDMTTSYTRNTEEASKDLYKEVERDFKVL